MRKIYSRSSCRDLHRYRQRSAVTACVLIQNSNKMGPSSQHFLVFCFALAYVLSDDSPNDKSLEQLEKCVKRGIASSTLRRAKRGSREVQDATKFMKETDKEHAKQIYDSTEADFNYVTNMTDANREKNEKQGAVYSQFRIEATEKGKQFNWRSFRKKNYMLYRWFDVFLGFPSKIKDQSNRKEGMSEIYNTAKECPYEEKKSRENCSLTLNTDLLPIFTQSRNPSELEYYWSEFRDVTGKKLRDLFVEHVKEANKGAKIYGFSDLGKKWIAEYESPSFAEDMAKVMKKIHPLYKQLHAYVRRKLMKYYKKVFMKKNGPIPAHLLGNIHAQTWENIFDIADPYPEKHIPNVTAILHKKKMKPLDMYILAEEFYLSIGLNRMTPYFWKNSVIEKPDDREVECSGAAYDFHDGKDYRIRYCTPVTGEGQYTVFHEMGHIQYFQSFSGLSAILQDSANPGFNEAIGDAMTLSSTSSTYLLSIGYIDSDEKDDPETDISSLLKSALKFIATVPYAYIVDLYRYGVYNGSIKTEELNKMWWQYRFDYQGVCPPIKRTEKDWDPGSKLHIPEIVEYMRYYFANIFTFQIHQSLCKEAGDKGPIHKCSIYRSKKAGKLFRKVLSMGKSKPWQEIMQILSGNETSSLDAEPLLKYFEPLFVWLKKKNKNHFVGWKSDDVMSCPGKSKKGKKSRKRRYT